MVVMYSAYTVIVDGEVQLLCGHTSIHVNLMLEVEIRLPNSRYVHVQHVHSIDDRTILHVYQRGQIIHSKLLVSVTDVLVHQEVEECLLLL